jgi:electron transfer flavoprotein alpha/beta subunit
MVASDAPPSPARRAGVAVWLGHALPSRSIRWLDGALATAAKLGTATAIAAGRAGWLDFAADRATRCKLPSVGVTTELELDSAGWAQVVAAVARELGVSTLLVDEASRPERAPEVSALAELMGAAQVTSATAVTPDGDTLHASCVTGHQLHIVRVRAPVVIGLRIAGPVVEEFPTPMPSITMRRLELSAIGIDPVTLARRVVPPRATTARKSLDRVAEFLAVHAERPPW